VYRPFSRGSHVSTVDPGIEADTDRYSLFLRPLLVELLQRYLLTKRTFAGKEGVIVLRERSTQETHDRVTDIFIQSSLNLRIISVMAVRYY
jgi:hypothetical protein